MRLSKQDREELLEFSKNNDCKHFEKTVFATYPGTKEATRQFTDFIQFFHKMAGHPTRKTSPPVEKIFLL